MTRPILLTDGTDGRTAIQEAFSIRQAFKKTTGLAGGNINVDFTPADVTDPDAGDPPFVLPSTKLMEPNQCYIAIISRLAEAVLTQCIVFNINHFKGLGVAAVPLVNVYKAMVADDPVVYRFRLHHDQDSIRFRFLALAVTDNIQVSIMKLS